MLLLVYCQAEIDKLSHACAQQSKSLQFIKKSVPGWNGFVLDAKPASSDTYTIWCMRNKPKHGPIFHIMQQYPVLDINLLSAFVIDMKIRFVLI